jgi:HD-GYP domain-containing protein (c-di-GMP phosphodiesterase class II)
MTNPLQLSYPVVTLDRRELLPAGAVLTPTTMEELVSSARSQSFPSKRLMEYGTIAKDLHSCLERPPYDRIFSNPKRVRAIHETLAPVEFVQPILNIYGYLKIHAPYTYRHILTVYALSLLLAQELITAPKELARVALAAPNHDFGKICIPLTIWKKTTPLTEQDRKYLSHHSAAGYVLLSYYYQDQNHPAALTARDHHERFNSTGYPRGIAQHNRVIEIVAVSDLFDALISPRPYRASPFDLRTALDEIIQLALNGAISSDVVRALICCNRTDQPPYTECKLSNERRGAPPAGNLYKGASYCLLRSEDGVEERQQELTQNLLLDISD